MQEILKYQQIDSEIRRIETEVYKSENRKNASELQDYLKMCQVELNKIEEASNALAEQYRKATLLYNDFIQRLEKLEKSIETSSDENLGALQASLQTFIENADVLASRIEVLSKKIDAADKKWDDFMNKAQKARAKLNVFKANYNKEKEKIEPEIARLKNELAKQGEKVNPKILAKYKAKAEGKLFPIFVPVNKGRCSGCRMEIPASKLSDLEKKGAIECENENCGRVVYQP